MADVGANEFGLCAEAAKLRGEGGAFFVVAARHDNSSAFAGEGDGGGTANAGKGAGDQDDRCAHLTTP